MFKTVKNLLVISAAAAVACILQVMGLVGYVSRLPEDCVGMGLFSFNAAAFATVSIGFFLQWRKQASRD